MWASFLDKVEAILGLLATFVLGFGAPLVCFLAILATLPNQVVQGMGWLGLVCLITPALLMLPLAALASVSMNDCFPEWSRARPREGRSAVQLPLAVIMASRLPRIPWFCRPILSLWWLGHFAAGVALGLGAYLASEKGLVGHPIARVVVPLLVDLGVLFAVNLYLLLALAVFFGTPRLWLKLWRARIVLDLTLVCLLRLIFQP